MLVGIAGSGKSTYAANFKEKKARKEENLQIFSSDDIREEYYGDASIQGDNNLIFNELNSRALHHLEQGYSVIYDATNLAAKNRIDMLHRVRAINSKIKAVCIFFDEPPKVCIKRQETRERKVPEIVIKRQHKQIEYPTYDEGWDTIVRLPQNSAK